MANCPIHVVAPNGSPRLLPGVYHLGYLRGMHKSPIAAGRAKAGHTQSVMAYGLGVTVVTVKRWEAGTRCPSGAHLLRLEEDYGVSPSEIIQFFEESRRPAPPSPMLQSRSGA